MKILAALLLNILLLGATFAQKPLFTGDTTTKAPSAGRYYRSFVGGKWYTVDNVKATMDPQGDITAGVNFNTAGVGVFQAKSGTDLRFKGIRNASTKLTVTDNTTNRTVDLDVNDAALTVSTTQVTGLSTALNIRPIQKAYALSNTTHGTTFTHGAGTAFGTSSVVVTAQFIVNGVIDPNFSVTQVDANTVSVVTPYNSSGTRETVTGTLIIIATAN
ncbi:hypothetical protein F5984_20490 [Rudanella paleaurantiibacter]|uniref:Uncharacterized protein n=1 Tax=Rudanella paleaurantiibacter TaxID=2614655 RepID=A0A7J5TVL6_9BACT|nr:hypothetical protein [Rudanella paleaurantiibacter]KAB7728127.1 hypothetical protein F5984_20490 [Rudanella paleaurantiibacter]